MAAALSLEGDAGGVSSPLDRADAITQGLSLVDSGVAYRAAAQQCGIHYATLWRAAKHREREALESLRADEDARRIQAKARIACEMAVERIIRDIPTCRETYVAPWAWTAARLAGIAEGVQAESGVTDGVAKLLTALGSRGSLTAAIQVQTGPQAPDSGPQITPHTPTGEQT